MTARRTYWHLEPLRRKPTDYDVVTSRLLYYPERGFEVDLPIGAWYARHQRGSPLRVNDWDGFRDPRETTYTRYTELQKAQEIYVDGLLESIEMTGHDQRLHPEWVALLDRVLAPLRYPVHALQMAAAYVASMAPGGRIVVAAALQAADEIRRVQRLAYRAAQLRQLHPHFARESRATWEDDPLWQPMRALLERLLVTYDFGEALVALNLAVKPAFDRLFLIDFGELAARRGDEVLGKIFLSLEQDCAWHRAWTAALVDHAITSDPDNRAVIDGWVETWREPVERAIAPFVSVLDARSAG